MTDHHEHNGVLSLTLPEGWGELSDRRLRFVFSLIADELDSVTVKTRCLFHFAGISVLCRYADGFLIAKGWRHFFVRPLNVAEAVQRLNFLDRLPDAPVRISVIERRRAADPALKGIDFQTYLYCDNLYQGFLQTNNDDMLRQMGLLLYTGGGKREPAFSKAERMNVFYWWTAAKLLLAQSFPNLFAGSGEAGNLLGDARSTAQKLNEAMNSQIRALTKGDITKEEQVLKMNLWRALTELDAIAREAEEINRKYNRHGR